MRGLLNYLVAAGYLAGNPLALKRSPSPSSARSRRIERYLDLTLWQVVLETLETWPQDTQRERQHYERSRWVLRLLYHTALRAGEAANARAADFFQRRGRWWLHVVGKGGVEGDVPVAEAVMADFARYRVFFGLPPMPAPGEDTPAIMSIAGGDKQHLTPTAIYLIAKEVFRKVADTLEPTPIQSVRPPCDAPRHIGCGIQRRRIRLMPAPISDLSRKTCVTPPSRPLAFTCTSKTIAAMPRPPQNQPLLHSRQTLCLRKMPSALPT